MALFLCLYQRSKSFPKNKNLRRFLCILVFEFLFLFFWFLCFFKKKKKTQKPHPKSLAKSPRKHKTNQPRKSWGEKNTKMPTTTHHHQLPLIQGSKLLRTSAAPLLLRLLGRLRSHAVGFQGHVPSTAAVSAVGGCC